MAKKKSAKKAPAKKGSAKKPSKQDLMPPSKQQLDRALRSPYPEIAASARGIISARNAIMEANAGLNRLDAGSNKARRASNQTSGMRSSARSYPRKGY